MVPAWLSRANSVLNVKKGLNAMKAKGKVETGLRENQQVAPRMEHYNAEFKGYINVALLDEEKDLMPAWLESVDFDEEIRYWCGDGCVLSMKLDPKTGNYMASATQRNEESTNAGLAVTARAGNPVKALYRLLYILSILGRGSWQDVRPMADPDKW